MTSAGTRNPRSAVVGLTSGAVPGATWSKNPGPGTPRGAVGGLTPGGVPGATGTNTPPHSSKLTTRRVLAQFGLLVIALYTWLRNAPPAGRRLEGDRRWTCRSSRPRTAGR